MHVYSRLFAGTFSPKVILKEEKAEQHRKQTRSMAIEMNCVGPQPLSVCAMLFERQDQPWSFDFWLSGFLHMLQVPAMEIFCMLTFFSPTEISKVLFSLNHMKYTCYQSYKYLFSTFCMPNTVQGLVNPPYPHFTLQGFSSPQSAATHKY